MIEIYTRKGCGMCDKIKKELAFYSIGYKEHLIDEEISRDTVLQMFPWATSLPIVVVNGEGLTPQEASKKLNEYKEHFGKTLLNEGDEWGD